MRRYGCDVFWFSFEVSPLFGCKESKRGPLKGVIQSIAISLPISTSDWRFCQPLDHKESVANDSILPFIVVLNGSIRKLNTLNLENPIQCVTESVYFRGVSLLTSSCLL